MTLQQCIENFLEHVETIEKYDDNDVDGYSREFKKLTHNSRKNVMEKAFPSTYGEEPYNLPKNRYKDILPYDRSRVTLSERPGPPGSDYINANFISGATNHKTYIASQGPQPHTVNDFWRMLWEYQTNIIIMACNEYEGIKLKCQRYWPKEGEDLEFAEVKVTLVEEQQNDQYLLRLVQAKVGDEVRLLYQFHYTAWPDHGTPTNKEQILDMVALARQYQRADQPPIVVHCSAGCGRTGCILAIDYTWSLLKLGKLSMTFSLFNLISEFRTQRQSLVQTEDQYIFVHLAVKELFQRHLVMMEEHLYENVYAMDGVCVQDSSTEDELYQDVPTTPAPSTRVLKQPPPIPNQKPQLSPRRSIPSSNSKSSISDSGDTSPKPPAPPKPERIFLTDSPTQTTIMQTIRRLQSGSDDDLYINTTKVAEFKLKNPVPKRLKGKNSSNTSATASQDKSVNNEKETESGSPVNKPSVGAKPSTPVKPTVPRKPSSDSSNSRSSSLNSKETNSPIDNETETASKNESESKHHIIDSKTKERIEGKTVVLPTVKSRTSLLKDGVKNANVKECEQTTGSDLVKVSDKVKQDIPQPLPPQKKTSPRQNYENIPAEEIDRKSENSKVKGSAQTVQQSYENTEPVKPRAEGETRQPTVKSKVKSWAPSEGDKPLKQTLSRTRSDSQKKYDNSQLAHSDVGLKKEKIMLQRNEKDTKVAKTDPLAKHKVTIDMDASQESIQNSTRLSRLGDLPPDVSTIKEDVEMVHEGGVKQQRTGAIKHDYIRKREQTYEEIESIENVKPSPKVKATEVKDTEPVDEGDYMEISSNRKPAPKPATLNNNSATNQTIPGSVDQNDDVFSSDDETQKPPVPVKSFSSSDDNKSINSAENLATGGGGKTLGRTLGKKFNQIGNIFKKDKNSAAQSSASSSGLSVWYKEHKVSFKHKVSKPKGPRPQTQNQHN